MYLQLLQVFVCVCVCVCVNVCFCAQKEKYLVNHSCFSPSVPLCSRYGPLQNTRNTQVFIYTQLSLIIWIQLLMISSEEVTDCYL